MGRRRKANAHLPARVYLNHGTYYFVDHQGQWHGLGRNLPDMYRNYARFIELGPAQTMAGLFQKYRCEVVPLKAARSIKDNLRYLKRLEAVFGHMRPSEVLPRHVYAYRTKRETAGKVTTNRELEVLKHVFTKAIEWGVVDINPARDVRKLSIPRRTRYVTDAEFQLVYAVAQPMIKVAMELAVLTGLRRGDILSLTRGHLTDEGIRVDTAKTGKTLLIEWSDTLQDVVDAAKQLSPQVRQHLVANRRGKPYTPDGFATQWDRAMARALKNGLAERFHFHDLRAKSASDDTLQTASERLGHSSTSTTERYYRRGPQRVRPLR